MRDRALRTETLETGSSTDRVGFHFCRRIAADGLEAHLAQPSYQSAGSTFDMQYRSARATPHSLDDPFLEIGVAGSPEHSTESRRGSADAGRHRAPPAMRSRSADTERRRDVRPRTRTRSGVIHGDRGLASPAPRTRVPRESIVRRSIDRNRGRQLAAPSSAEPRERVLDARSSARGSAANRSEASCELILEPSRYPSVCAGPRRRFQGSRDRCLYQIVLGQIVLGPGTAHGSGRCVFTWNRERQCHHTGRPPRFTTSNMAAGS